MSSLQVYKLMCVQAPKWMVNIIICNPEYYVVNGIVKKYGHDGIFIEIAPTKIYFNLLFASDEKDRIFQELFQIHQAVDYDRVAKLLPTIKNGKPFNSKTISIGALLDGLYVTPSDDPIVKLLKDKLPRTVAGNAQKLDDGLLVKTLAKAICDYHGHMLPSEKRGKASVASVESEHEGAQLSDVSDEEMQPAIAATPSTSSEIVTIAPEPKPKRRRSDKGDRPVKKLKQPQSNVIVS